MTLTAPSPRRAASALAVALVSLAAAGCGSSASSAGDDPAGLVPSRAPVYVEATVAPDGTLRTDALAAAGKILGTSRPEARIAELLRGAGGHDVDFARDVQPWLGRQVGLFFLPRATGDGDGAVVADAADTDRAAAFVRGRGAKTETYKGVEIHLDGTDATALVADDVVAGSRAGVHASIDASKGGSLAEAGAFKDAMAKAGDDDALGRAYIAPRALLRVAASSSKAGSVAPLGDSLRTTLPSAIAMRATADGRAVRIDAATVGGQGSDGADPALVAALPADAWLAAGIGKVGATLRRQIDQLGNIGGVDAASLLAIVKSQTGLDVQQDLLRWMGQGALYVRGTSASQLGGALVVRSTDPAATRAAIGKIQALLPRLTQGAATATPLRQSGVDAGFELRGQGIPVPVALAAAGDRFVLAVGDGVLGDVISPAATLGAGADFRSAAALLGGGLKPVLYLGARPVADLIGSMGGAQDAAGRAQVRQVQRTLRRFTALVGASRGEGRSRAVLGLR